MPRALLKDLDKDAFLTALHAAVKPKPARPGDIFTHNDSTTGVRVTDKAYVVDESLKLKEIPVADLDVFRRARDAREAYEATLPEEIWILPPGGATDEQMLRVAAIIDAEEAAS